MALPTWLSVWSPVVNRLDDLPASCTLMTFPSGDLLVLSLATTLVGWIVMHGFLHCWTPVLHTFCTWTLSYTTLRLDLLLLWHTMDFRWQDVMAFACVALYVMPCVIWLRGFTNVLYIFELSRWSLILAGILAVLQYCILCMTKLPENAYGKILNIQ